MKRLNLSKVLTFLMLALPAVIDLINQGREHFKDDEAETEGLASRKPEARNIPVSPQTRR